MKDRAKQLLKNHGADGELSTTCLFEWFLQNPTQWIGTTEMGQLGLSFRYKNGNICFPNQATLEKKARDLRGYGLIKSRGEGRFVVFRLDEAVEGQIVPSRRREAVIEGGVFRGYRTI